MSFDPSSIISLIQNCKTLYDYYADVRHSSEERRRLLDEVRSLQSQLEALKKLTETSGIAGDEASMGQLAKLLDPTKPFDQAVEATLDAVGVALGCRTSNSKPNKVKVLWRRLVAALWWTIKKEEAKQLLSDLERYKNQIGLALQHDNFKKQDVMDGKLDVVDGKLDVVDGKQAVMDGKLDDVEENLSNKDRLEIAKFISEHDYTSDCKQLLEKKLSGTGSWLINDSRFVAWRDERESPNRTLWCYGHPGAGKSVMAALIIEHLQSAPNNIVLSVFCRYSSSIFTTPFGVLSGLLRQLIEKTTTVPRAICDLYWRKTNPRPDALTGFLDEIAVCHGQAIYIIVDALDECPFGSDLLRALLRLGSSFRVLITSRPVFPEIDDFPSIQIRASDDDILTAVNATLEELRHGWLDEDLKNEIREKIVEKADGMFLLASLQLRELERDVTRPRDVIAILDSLPRTLDDAYKLTFQRIREQGERKNELACRALALIALHLLLHTLHVQHLLAEGDETQYTDIETILQCCHGLVHRPTGEDYFKFIHYSVHEYITAHRLELFPENPNRSDVSLKLGYSILIRPLDEFGMNVQFWNWIVNTTREPEGLEHVISLLLTPAVRAALVEYNPDLAPFVHDPLLTACYQWYENVLEYIIQTAPPDAERFNEALRVCRSQSDWRAEQCITHINTRLDMRVNSDGVVVAVDREGGEEFLLERG